MICPKCKITIEEDSAFCKHCGANIQGAGATAEPAAERPAGPAGPSPAGGEGAAREDVYRDPKFEKQVWSGRPAWRSRYGTWALWAIVSAVILGAAYKWRASSSITLSIAWIVIVGIAVVILVREALLVLSLAYRLTTQRLFVRRGIFSRVTDQVELVRVDDVRLRQGLVDRLVNTGDVEVISSDPSDPKLILEAINAPHEVAESLRTHVRGARSRGTVFVEQV